MKIKLLGATICLAVIALTWWLYWPKKEVTSSKIPGPLVQFETKALFISKNKLEPAEPQTVAPPPAPTNKAPLTNEEIEQTFAQYQRQFQNCWVQRLKDNPQLKGRVSFQITISPRGKINEIQLSHSEIDDALMLQCLNSTLSRMSFREFRGDSIEVLFPLEFDF